MGASGFILEMVARACAFIISWDSSSMRVGVLSLRGWENDSSTFLIYLLCLDLP